MDKPSSASSTPPLFVGLTALPSLPLSPKQCSYEGGTCEFLQDPPQKFICSICTQLVKDPHLTACCGHEFCEGCLKEWEKKSVTRSCPHCRNAEFVHILDKQTQREINQLKVYCPKRSNGCVWEGQLSQMKSHESDCSFFTVKCPHCSMSVPRKDLESHSTTACPLRESKCCYCDKKDAYFKVISFVHLAECPGYPMDCPNKCGAIGIKRSNLPAHRKSCPSEEIECPLRSAGCSEKMLRKDLGLHVSSKQGDHLLYLMTAFEKSQKELQKQRQDLRELKMFQVTASTAMTRMSSSMDQFLEKSLTTEVAPLRAIRALLGPGTLILNAEHREISLVLPNYSQLEKNKTSSWESLPFYLGAGYKACLVFLPRAGKSNDLGAELRLLPGEFDCDLLWPCDINFANISLSLKKEGVHVDFSPSTKGQPPFSLSSKGTTYHPLAACRGTASHLVLWHTTKLMNALPPYPSAVRANYLHHDCLTVMLTWADSLQSTGTTSFAMTGLQLFLPKSPSNKSQPSDSAGGSQLLSGSVVSVFTSGAGQADGTGRQNVNRARRRKI